MGTVTRLPCWKQRVYKLASLQLTMGEATMFCRANGVMPYPEYMVKLNPLLYKKVKP